MKTSTVKNLLCALSLFSFSCSDLSSIDNPAYRGLAPGVCSGTPVACSQRLDGRCGGCYRSSLVECHGPVVARCADLSGAACNADPECTVELAFFTRCVTKACHALPEATCNATAGCGYSAPCSGADVGLAPCDEAKIEADCVAVSGCTWTSKGSDGGS